jgi:fatty acid synthase subunit beta
VNRKIENDSEHLAVALVNGNNVCVVGGQPILLSKFATLLQKSNSTEGKDHSKVPFYKRKPRVTLRWVPVSAPFHCPQMKACVPRIMEDVSRIGLSMRGSNLRFPVYATNNGENLQGLGDIMKALVDMQCTQMVDFPACLAKATRENGVTHVLDFGPGGSGGAAQLAARIFDHDGRGVSTVLAVSNKMENEAATVNRPELLGMNELLKENVKSLHTKTSSSTFGSFWPTLDKLTVSNAAAYQGPFPTNCNVVVTDM